MLSLTFKQCLASSKSTTQLLIRHMPRTFATVIVNHNQMDDVNNAYYWSPTKEDLIKDPSLIDSYAGFGLHEIIDGEVENLRLFAYAKHEVFKRETKADYATLRTINLCIALAIEAKICYEKILENAPKASKEWAEALSDLKKLLEYTQKIAPEGSQDYLNAIKNMKSTIAKHEHTAEYSACQLR